MTPKIFQRKHVRQIVLTGVFLIAVSVGIANNVFTQSDAHFQGSGKETEKEGAGKVTFGYSEQGRAIDGYVFGQGETRMLFFAGLHGTEKGATQLLYRLVREIEQDPSRVSHEKSVIIIPIANPDGYEARDDKLNANGVNLNRNFFTSDWVQFADFTNPETFAGPEPFSESESRVLRAVVESYQPTIMIAYHSQGALVSPEAGDASHQLAKWYTENTGYLYYDEWDFAGTATKWFTQTFSNPALTVELTNHTDDDWEINRKAMVELLR